MAADLEAKSSKERKGYSHEQYLLGAAELMRHAQEPEVSAELIREANERKFDAEKRHELHNLGNGLIRTPRSQQGSKKGDKSDTEQTNFSCRLCGFLQNPLKTHFRIKPKIRKRRKKCMKEKLDTVQNTKTSKETQFHANSFSNERSLICLGKEIVHGKKRKPRHARKCHFITAKCDNCKNIFKAPCEPLQKPTIEKRESKMKSRDNSQATQKIYSNFDKKIKCKTHSMEKVGFETPKAPVAINLVSKSAKKRNRMKNSPLARLLADKKPSDKKSPGLKSFLFDT